MEIKTKQLYTPEGESVLGGEKPYREYPRPLLRRESFISLDGEWELEFCGEKYNIQVPFCPESVLSGIGRVLDRSPKYIYRKSFSLPDNFNRGRVILHFGAVDQICECKVNCKAVGGNIGGYNAFEFDITDALVDGENTIELYVEDNLDNAILPYGKQTNKRGGMWYTPVSGIWQSVWLESVPENYIRKIEITTTLDSARIKLYGCDEGSVTYLDGEAQKTVEFTGGVAIIKPEVVKLWTPDEPNLYEFKVKCGDDEFTSYFALREITTKVIDGVPRICLNGEPIFLNGLLDQGYFPDGIFTAASDEGYKNDILTAKKLGFNTLRKHIKVEPEVLYYYCDKYGMIVVQDMVNNGKYSFLRDTALPTVGMKSLPDRGLHKNKKSRDAFVDSMIKTVNQLKNHPSICMWTIFNEGWGQFSADEMYHVLRKMDSSRIIDTASGWFRPKNSDVVSEHIYFKKVRIKCKRRSRPVFLSEFGGYSHKVEGHIFNLDNNYGYGSAATVEEFEKMLRDLYTEQVIPNIKNGLSGAILTQITDVEDETNGLITYDRRVVKIKEPIPEIKI